MRVPESDNTLVVQAPFLEFRAAAPIVNTRTTHEYQSDPAASESRKKHVIRGSGAQIYLCVREESEEEQWNACTVGIHGLDGELLANLDAGFVDERARIAALNVELDPGTYALRVSGGVLGAYEMYVTASEGWQTQVFFLFENFWTGDRRVRAPSLRRASLLMAHSGAGFDPFSPISRTAELARQALEQGRDVISGELLKKLLDEKFEDPILGIIGAHQLLKRRRRDVQLLHIVCKNLVGLLGTHPDVLSLRLALGETEESKIDCIQAPPSLRQSWEEITKATRRRAGLVPANSVVARIAANVVRGGPWLLREVPAIEDRTPAAAAATIAGAVRTIDDLLARRFEQLGRLTEDSATAPLSGLERTVLGAAASIARSRRWIDRSEEQIDIDDRLASRSLLRDIDAPPYAIATAVMSLAEKLESEI